MAIIKCKMCGGDLVLVEGASVAECEYCGTRQTVPSADSEKKLTLFGRAGRLLRACEFDKAAGVYEGIVAEFPEEAEAYWGLVLCKYGIEYVDDPATGRKIPTCHRSSFDSVLDDENFDQACENADSVARRLYRDEAKAIEELRRGIIEVSGREAPYDIFICYKETSEDGGRTLDSVLAQDIYDALTERGYRVFFSRVTLEDKLGQEYEPYIFAALNSAKVMLAVGTDYEHYNAVWVKNEWSRFLQLIAGGQKKTLIPCYKGIDAYDMPKEFAKLQAQDLGKVGAMQDLLRGVDKLLGKGAQAAQTIVQQVSSGPSVDSLCKRGELFLESGNWVRADEYFDKALDTDPECARAYLGKFLAGVRASDAEALLEPGRVYRTEDDNIRLALRFAAGSEAERLRALLSTLQRREKLAQVARAVRRLKAQRETAEKERERKESAQAGFRRAEAMRKYIAAGYKDTVGMKSDGTVAVATNDPSMRRAASDWWDIVAIGAGFSHVVGLKSDGTVVATGYNFDSRCDVSGWTNIVAIAVGDKCTVGLKANGKVVVAGNDFNGQCNVSGWQNIVAVAAGSAHIVGLKSDGTVVATAIRNPQTFPDKGQCDVSSWTNIVSIAARGSLTVGLKADGTVVAAGEKDAGAKGGCYVGDWRDIVAIAVGDAHIVGLKSNGKVVATGHSTLSRCSVKGWEDIVAIAVGDEHTVGLKSDGTVVATGHIGRGRCNVSGWEDIVAIAAGGRRTVGLKSDGTVVATGEDDEERANVSGWKLFNCIDTLEEEVSEARRAAAERRDREEEARKAAEEARRAAEEKHRKERVEALNKEAESLKTELANLRGLFTGKRRKEIEARLAAIDRELNRLK